jgi:hypothetical protein
MPRVAAAGLQKRLMAGHTRTRVLSLPMVRREDRALHYAWRLLHFQMGLIVGAPGCRGKLSANGPLGLL